MIAVVTECRSTLASKLLLLLACRCLGLAAAAAAAVAAVAGAGGTGAGSGVFLQHRGAWLTVNDWVIREFNQKKTPTDLNTLWDMYTNI